MLDLSLLPFIELETERLLMRRILSTDVKALFALRTNKEVLRYLDRELQESEADVLAVIERIDTNLANNDGINWAMTLKPDNKLIGNIGLWKIDKSHHRAEIGYMLMPEHMNKGLMTEALNKVLDHGFQNMKLHSVEAHINPNNAASKRILQKAGFVTEGYFKENYYYKGKFLDTEVLSLLAP